MGLLPDYQQAIVSNEKLAGYCLNEEHPVGKDKAFLFRTLLGITLNESDWLKQKILEAITVTEAKETKIDQYRQLYIIDFPVHHNGRTCQIRTCWIVLKFDKSSRLTSCYIL